MHEPCPYCNDGSAHSLRQCPSVIVQYDANGDVKRITLREGVERQPEEGGDPLRLVEGRRG